MKFIADKKIFEKFPGVNIGMVVAREINNTGDVTLFQSDWGDRYL